MADELNETVRDWGERLELAEKLAKEGNLSRATVTASAVEQEVDGARARAGVGSEGRRAAMAMLKRARAVLERIEAAAFDDDEDAEEDDDPDA
jgi:hypothetical protein